MVSGELLVKLQHEVVAVRLGQDACSSYAHVLAVAFDDGRVGKVLVRHEAVAIDDDFLRSQLELVEGAVHGQDAGTEYVDLVYLFVCDDAHCPGKCLSLYDFPEGITLLLAELLGVVQHGPRTVVH